MNYDPAVLQKILTIPELAEFELSFKPMFGGIMGYAGGKVFASLSNVGLALKMSGKDREALLALPGACALRYEPESAPSKTYVVVPESLHARPDELKIWVARSIAALPAKKSH
ncbi:TfoX/Sxy family protein [Asaia bogorensis]|uniref:TfoX/Sxy family protein n=1 Tax=Asaia bogorensis TaxID=91915 RepID=UPI002858E59B|nr:TfoX/Sxy family protein [Asaia bogorensis]MDR6181167.1 TfoX/Sxy family transcriptional regulator of competence genes [Asaia bogorensis NBRC 16594]